MTKLKITEEEFQILVKELQTRFKDGDEFYGFISSGKRYHQTTRVKFPLYLADSKEFICCAGGSYFYCKNPIDCDNYPINLTRGETLDKDKITNYSII
jgi:hypothetical protein